MKLRISVIVLAFLFGMGACSGEKGRDEPENRVTPEKTLDEDSSVLKKKTKPLKEEVQQEIGIIEEFTPATFVRLTILYRKESLRWLEESAVLSDLEQQHYFEESSRAFFKQFGVTEEEYTKYSAENIDELNSYMEEHPELIGELQGE